MMITFIINANVELIESNQWITS